MDTLHEVSIGDIEFAVGEWGPATILRYTASHRQIRVPQYIEGMEIGMIADNAFADCGLQALELPNSVLEIGEGAFAGNALTQIVLPVSVSIIPDRAFSGNRLTQVMLPSPHIQVSDTAFDGDVEVLGPTDRGTALEFEALFMYPLDAMSLRAEIRMQEVDTQESLHQIADIYLALAKNLDRDLAGYRVDRFFDDLRYQIEVLAPFDGEHIFQKMMGHPELEQKAAAFVTHLNRWSRETEVQLWHDDELPLGAQEAFVMGMCDSQYIELYCDLLKTCDMDHETVQWEHIDCLIAEHGLCEETIKLMAYRLGVGIGQGGDTQIDEYASQLHAYFDTHPQMKSVLLDTAVLSIYQNGRDSLSFHSIEVIAGVLQDEGEKANWLAKQKELALAHFGERNVRFD